MFLYMLMMIVYIVGLKQTRWKLTVFELMTWVQLQHTRPVSPLYQRCREGPPDFFYLLFCFRWSCLFVCLITLCLNFVREKRKWLALLRSCSSRWCYKRAFLNVPVHKEPNCEQRSNPRWCRAYDAQLRRILTHGCCNTWTVRICMYFRVFSLQSKIFEKEQILSLYQWSQLVCRCFGSNIYPSAMKTIPVEETWKK